MKKRNKKQIKAKAWIKFIIIEVLMLILFLYVSYDNRKITIDECETFVAEIIDIKAYDRVNAKDIIYIQTNLGDFYIFCYNRASRYFPVEAVINEKKLTLSVKNDVDIINLYRKDIREIVDLRSDTTVYLDFQAYEDYTKSQRMYGYIFAPIFSVLVTAFAVIICFDSNAIIKFIELLDRISSRNKKKRKPKS